MHRRKEAAEPESQRLWVCVHQTVSSRRKDNKDVSSSLFHASFENHYRFTSCNFFWHLACHPACLLVFGTTKIPSMQVFCFSRFQILSTHGEGLN